MSADSSGIGAIRRAGRRGILKLRQDGSVARTAACSVARPARRS